jgi:hypothetical protein
VARIAPLSLIALAGLCLLPGGSAAAEGAPAPRWMPLEPGSRWSYVVLREQSRESEGREEVVETLRGTRVDEVVATEGGLEIRSQVRTRAEGAPSENVERERRFVEATAGGYRVLAEEAPGALGGAPQRVRFDPPLTPLRADVDAGQSWAIGVDQRGGMRTELRGEILGVQDARTPAGLFERCLVVRTTGSLTGSVDVSGERIQVREGKSERTEWYAPGVGLVLAKEDRERHLELPDGQAVVLRERVEYALEGAEGAPAAESASEATGPDAPGDPEEHPAAPTPPPG